MMIRNAPQRTHLPDNGAGDPSPPRILVAEDDDEMRLLLAWSLRWEGYDVVQCQDGMQLLDALSTSIVEGETERLALVISDIRMPGISGLEILRGLQLSNKFPPMVLITAFGDEETHAEADRLGAAAMFDKPFAIEALMVKVREILKDARENGGEGGDPGSIPA
jgi:DNA-binding response OmpR family regulator